MNKPLRLTETPNPHSASIDERSTLEILKMINEEDQLVPQAVGRALNEIADSVEIIVKCLQMGGRMIYLGAGTSGRLGILDAYECPPTFGTDPNLVRALIAGSSRALRQAAEDGEDDIAEASSAIAELQVDSRDAVIGISASGSTPYVIKAIAEAKARGAKTILITNNLLKEHQELFDRVIPAITGPEILAGSTRMKAGTAQKMILNMLSTCAMIRLNKVYDGYMIHMRPTNQKLRERAVRIVLTLAECAEPVAREALLQTDWKIGAAILSARFSINAEKAVSLLEKCGGNLRRALREQEEGARCVT